MLARVRPSSETEDAIDLPVVVSFALQSLLHLPDIVPIPDRWHFFAEVGSQSGRRWTWSETPVVSNMKTIPAHAALPA
jgi:hypothetical protein